MILPIGHEQGSVKRLPWVTFGIMGLCLLSLLLTHGSASSPEERVNEIASELSELFMENPWLVISEESQDVLFPGMSERDREAIMAAYEGMMPPPEDDARRADIQAEFEALLVELQTFVDEHPYRKWGLIPAHPSLVTLFTHMFMHGGWLHLLGNLFILYLAGPFIEDVWGRGLFAGFYVGAGLAAAVLFIVIHPAGDIPLIGASGAIAGVMGAFLVRYWQTQIHFFYVFGFVFHGTFSAPAWAMLPMWFLEQLFMASLDTAGASGVAYWAHVGGFVVGVGAAMLIKSYKVEERFIRPKLDAVVNKTLVDNSVVDQALEARASGQSDEAFRLLADEARRKPRNADVALALWAVALDQNRTAEAAPAMLRLIRDEIRRGQMREAMDHWLGLVARVHDLAASPLLLVKLAGLLSGAGKRDDAAAALRLALLDPAGELTAAIALRIARAAEGLDTRVSQGAARMVLALDDANELEKRAAGDILAAVTRPGIALR